jgi:hypothetical protein
MVHGRGNGGNLLLVWDNGPVLGLSPEFPVSPVSVPAFTKDIETMQMVGLD